VLTRNGDTDADRYRAKPGYRWSVGAHCTSMIPVEDRPGWVTPGLPDYWFLTSGNNLKDAAPRRHFKSQEAAERAAKELNDADAVASLNVPATHKKRFERYRKLHTHFGWWWYDGEHHPLTRFPREPGRYAVETWSDDGDSVWSDHETLNDVRGQIEDGDVHRVVDLDTGKDVEFTRTVHVEIGGGC
jgi:hypothetical protein